MIIKLETLPNEILMKCFEYLHTLERLHSLSELNHRFEQLLQTLPWHLTFEDIQKKAYDAFCQDILTNPDAQQQVCSLRLSNRDTPGIIDDFFSKFSLDQFSHLRLLTLVGVEMKNLQALEEILLKSSQIAALHLEESESCRNELVRLVPISHRYTLSMDPSFYFVRTTISIKSLTLLSLSLNEICRLFQYTPLLRYFRVFLVREESLKAKYHQSPRPPYLKHLNLGYFESTFNDLTHFLQNMSNLRSLTIDSSNDQNMVDASRWEQLITSSLPDLNDFRFKLALILWWDEDNARRIFDRFQTNFWLKDHQWHTEYLVSTECRMIYTIPYIPAVRPIPLVSKRYRNLLFDDSQTFKHMKTLVVSSEDVLEHGEYYFPNLTSLLIQQKPQNSIEYDGQMMNSLTMLMSFYHLKHLEIRFDCRLTQTSLLFRILDVAPQLSSLRTKPCFFELLQNEPESYRQLNGKIRKLDLSDDYCDRGCQGRVSMSSLYGIVPDVEQLTMSLISVDDWFFLLSRFSKLSGFRVRVSSVEPGYQHLKMQALKNALFYEEEARYRCVNLAVWIRGDTVVVKPAKDTVVVKPEKDTVVVKPEKDTEESLSYFRGKFQRFMKRFEKKIPRKS